MSRTGKENGSVIASNLLRLPRLSHIISNLNGGTNITLGRINHLHFYVEDLEETYKYFTEKLGFKFVRRGHGGKSVDLVSSEGGPTFEFNQITEEYKNTRAPGIPGKDHFAYERRPYLDHIACEVDDLDKEYEELKSRGVKFKHTPVINPQNKRKLVDTCDAEGKRWIQLQGKGG